MAVTNSPPLGDFIQTISIPSATSEWRFFKIERPLADYEIRDDKYLTVLSRQNSVGDLTRIERTQFVSSELYLLFLQTALKQNQLYRRSLLIPLIESDSLSKTKASEYREQLSEIELFLSEQTESDELTEKTLDSLWQADTIKFNDSKKLAILYRDSTEFDFSRKVFNAYLEYLEAYEKSYTSSEFSNKVLTETKVDDSFALDSLRVVVIWSVDTAFYNPERENWHNLYSEAERKYDDPFIAKWFFLKPIMFLFLDLTESFISSLPEETQDKILDRIDSVLDI